MKKSTIIKLGLLLLILLSSLWYKFIHLDQRSWDSIFGANPNPRYEYGEVLDSFNGVKVYYNGKVAHVSVRSVTKDGYNLGLNYQCVEFVKRYYYQYYKHKMPDSYGHAKQYIDPSVPSGNLNKKRGLIQYNNGEGPVPEIGDLVVFDGHSGNTFGHVAIVCKVDKNKIQIIQQNPGAFGAIRAEFEIENRDNKYRIKSDRLLGWLRMKK